MLDANPYCARSTLWYEKILGGLLMCKERVSNEKETYMWIEQVRAQKERELEQYKLATILAH